MGDDGLLYWWRWEVPVCALIVAVPALICAVLIVKKLGAGGDEVGHGGLWVPCWKSLNPRWLMVYRALAFFSMAWMLYQMVAIDGVFAFYFYTRWTFALVMVYFAIGTTVSAHGCWFRSGKGKAGEGDDESSFLSMEDATRLANEKHFALKEKASTDAQTYKQAGLLGYPMTIIYQICAGAVILTDIVFWCILVPMQQGKDFKVTPLVGSIHSLNAAFLIIDSALNSLPFQWFGFTYFVCWSAAYIIFQWALHASGLSWWPYPFLELATPWAPLWYLGLAVFHVPCYGIYMILIKAKLSAFPRLFPQEFVSKP